MTLFENRCGHDHSWFDLRFPIGGQLGRMRDLFCNSWRQLMVMVVFFSARRNGIRLLDAFMDDVPFLVSDDVDVSWGMRHLDVFVVVMILPAILIFGFRVESRRERD